MAYRGSITPFGAGGSIFGLRREIDRLFEDAYGGHQSAWSPSVNVREANDAVLLEMELPGIAPDDVDISIDNDVLTVSGEKHHQRQDGDAESRYYLVERRYGSFSRSFSLPQNIDHEKVSADFDHGLLTIRIPREALPQPRRIQIGSSGSTARAEVKSGRAERSRSASPGAGGRHAEAKMAATSRSDEES